MPNQSQLTELLQFTGNDLIQKNLAWGNAGNASARLDEDTCLITASGTRFGELTNDSFACCSLSGKAPARGGKPSKEWPMHRAVYLERPETGAVIHAAPYYSTFAACSGMKVPSELFVETMYYLERVERVPYCHPGSQQLADQVRKKARYANVLLLENHGVLVFDETVNEAKNALEVLEIACKMVVTAKQSRIELNRLPASSVQSFLEESGYKKRREWPEDDRSHS